LANVWAPAEGFKGTVERTGQLGEVAVIDGAGVQLGGEFVQYLDPMLMSQPKVRCRTRGLLGWNLNPALDDPDRRPARRSRARLFPRSLSTGRRAPLGDSSACLELDRAVAPPTGGGSEASAIGLGQLTVWQ
jgi:hypothetical protein